MPADYSTSDYKYPVLYMHDGQNLFDEATSPFGEWGVDDALDTLNKGARSLIVVGIDNGSEQRLREYSPYDMEKYGKGEGKAYTEFLAKTLKPFIDKHYRTKKDSKNTFIAGSSMGGLISLYAILAYPKIFGAAGVFSPAIWIAPAINKDVRRLGPKLKGRIYFYAGAEESKSMVEDMLAAFTELRKISKAKMKTVVRAGGRHNEPTWRSEFALFFEWLMEK